MKKLSYPTGRTVALALLVAATLLTASCSPHKTGALKPDLQMPGAYTSAAYGKALLNGASGGPWWEAFGDEALNAIMDETLSSNLDVAQAIERLRQARAQAKISGAPLIPKVSAGGAIGATRTRGLGGPGGPGAPLTTHKYQLSVAAN